MSAGVSMVERMYETVVRCGDQLADLVAGLDPDAVSGPAARQWWAAFDRVERLAAGAKTLLARRVAATHQRNGGTRSAAEDLARRAGSTTGAARDAVDTSHRLPDQPGVAGALRRGELSPAQAAVISSAAAANPAEEHRLVGLAGQVSVPELREECGRVKAAADPDPEATNRRLHAQRRLRRWTDAEGGWNLSARGTPQAGAAFNTAIDPIIDALFHDARRAGRPEPVEAYGFDALIHLAEHAAGRCSCHPPTQTAPDSAGTADGGQPAAVAAASEVEPAGRSMTRPGSRTGGVAGEPGIFAAGVWQAGPTCQVRPGRRPIRDTWRCYGSTSKRCTAGRSPVRNCARSPASGRSRCRWPADSLVKRSSNWSSPTAST
jgi:hypothetical protein